MSSIEYRLIEQTKFHLLYSCYLSYLFISCFTYPNETDLCVMYFYIFFQIGSTSSFFKL